MYQYTHTIPVFCPQCENCIPFFIITDDSVEIICNAKSTDSSLIIKINDYLEKYPNNKQKQYTYVNKCSEHHLQFKFYCPQEYKQLCIKCKEKERHQVRELTLPINLLKERIEKAKEHLYTYFSQLKDKAIIQFKEQKTKIEKVYNDSFNFNKDCLDLYTILVNNYNGDNNEYYNVLTSEMNHLNLYKCIEGNEPNVKYIINFFKNYNLMNIKPSLKFGKMANSYVSLRDGRIAGISQSIRIYDIKQNFNSININPIDNGNSSLCQLDNEMIVISNINNIHYYTLEKTTFILLHKIKCNFSSYLVSLTNNCFAVVMNYTAIQIFNGEAPYKDTPIATIYLLRDYITAMIYMKEKNVLVVGFNESKVGVVCVISYQLICVLDIDCQSENCLLQIDNDRVIIGGKNETCILNVTKGKIDNKSNMKSVCCFMKTRDHNKILCGTNEIGMFYLYDIKENNYIMIKSKKKENV